MPAVAVTSVNRTEPEGRLSIAARPAGNSEGAAEDAGAKEDTAARLCSSEARGAFCLQPPMSPSTQQNKVVIDLLYKFKLIPLRGPTSTIALVR